MLFGRAGEVQVAKSSAGIQGWGHFADHLAGQTRVGVGGIEESTFGTNKKSTSYIKPLDRVIQCHHGRMPDL